MFPFRIKFCKLFSLIEIWGWLSHFFITNCLCIYDYMLKKWLNISIFNISTFPMLLCCFLLRLIKIFPKSHDFLNKNFVKHFSTVVKYFELTSNTKI